ncbi:MAG: globin [Acidimicrobiales bacterium]
MTDAEPGTPVTLYEAVGGRPYFTAVVDEFYRRVASDPVLEPMYPDDLVESRRMLTLFLIQYWGGPTDYSDERGHPRLRMRHGPFVIGEAERSAWLEHMRAAVGVVPLPAGLGDDAVAEIGLMLDRYFEHASQAMINHPS